MLHLVVKLCQTCESSHQPDSRYATYRLVDCDEKGWSLGIQCRSIFPACPVFLNPSDGSRLLAHAKTIDDCPWYPGSMIGSFQIIAGNCQKLGMVVDRRS